jgi:hypothetical protein
VGEDKAHVAAVLEIGDQHRVVQFGAQGARLEVCDRVQIANVEAACVWLRAVGPVLLHVHPKQSASFDIDRERKGETELK